ncbi:hypothetical protein NAH47_25920, partial [Klebsiella pneumoniae]
QRMAEYLVLYNSKRPHKSLELMTPVDYILRESKNCNMWWTHTSWMKSYALHDDKQTRTHGLRRIAVSRGVPARQSAL